MTDDQLYVLLASYEQKVSHHEDRALFAEAVRAAKASALRAAYFTLWLCCVASLKRRLSDRAKHEPLIDPLLVELGSTAATQTPAIALLLEQAQKHDLLLGAGAAKLQRLDALQQTCRDAKAAAPPLADFVFARTPKQCPALPGKVAILGLTCFSSDQVESWMMGKGIR